MKTKQEKKTQNWLTGIGMCAVILTTVVYTWVVRQRRKLMEALLFDDASLIHSRRGKRKTDLEGSVK